MKIHIITTETFPNGLAATQRIKCYAKSIVSLGYNCEVICLNRCEDKAKPLGNTLVYGEIDGYTYRYMGNSTSFSSNKFWKIFYQTIDTLKLIIDMLFSFKNGDKIVFYSYNAKLLDIVKKFSSWRHLDSYYEINEHPSIQFGGFSLNDDSVEDLSRLLDRLKGFRGYFCISTALKQLLIRCGIPESHVHLINMIVNYNRFKGIEKDTSEQYIAYCGTAENNKDGVNQLIMAFEKLINKYPSIKLYVIGKKRPECNNEELAKHLGIANKVVFTGMVTPLEIPKLLTNATVLALDRPDSIQAKYGFPTKLGEYLSTGNPVVITSVGDISLFLKDGESAFIAEPDNVDSFAAKLDEALGNPEQAKRVGENGRKVVEKYFSDQKVKEQLKQAMNL